MAAIQSLHLQAASETARIHDRIEHDRQILNAVKAARIISIYEAFPGLVTSYHKKGFRTIANTLSSLDLSSLYGRRGQNLTMSLPGPNQVIPFNMASPGRPAATQCPTGVTSSVMPPSAASNNEANTTTRVQGSPYYT